MIAFILYQPKSDSARSIEEFVRDFKRTTGRDVLLMDLNSREAADKAKLYDVVRYPSLLVTRDDGQLLRCWDDGQMPLMNELSAYLAS